MNTKRFELVDFLKGFSIFTIVVMHLLQPIFSSGVMSKAIAFGGAGVHVFILCSGFGLYLSYLHKPLPYGQFLRRRFIKIYIPYIIVITISAIIPFYNTSDSKWIEYASHIYYLKCSLMNMNVLTVDKCGLYQLLSSSIYYGQL